MSVGDFFDKLIMLAGGIYAVYLSKAKREKLGNKAKILNFCGIALIIITFLLVLVDIFTKK